MAYPEDRGDPAPDPYRIPLDDGPRKRGFFAEIIAELKAVIVEARELIAVEREYFKARLDFTKRHVVKLIVMAVAAAVCALLLAFALVMGALLSLSTLVGPLLATIIVACALIIITAVLGLGCKRAVKDIKLTR